jgi:hypothetical protein
MSVQVLYIYRAQSSKHFSGAAIYILSNISADLLHLTAFWLKGLGQDFRTNLKWYGWIDHN